MDILDGVAGVKDDSGTPLESTTDVNIAVPSAAETEVPDLPVSDLFAEANGEVPTVPVTAVQKMREAEKAKREALEARIKELEAVSDTPAPAVPQAPEFDWEAVRQPVGVQQSNWSPEQIAAYNEELKSRFEQDPTGTFVQMFTQFYTAVKQQETAMDKAVKKFVPGYKDLPMDAVSDEEMHYVSSNPLVLKAVIAHLKQGKTAAAPMASVPTVAPGVSKAEAVAELRRQVAEIEASAKMSGAGVGASAHTEAITKESWVGVTDAEKEFLKRRNLDAGTLAKQLKRLKDVKNGQRGMVLDV